MTHYQLQDFIMCVLKKLRKLCRVPCWVEGGHYIYVKLMIRHVVSAHL